MCVRGASALDGWLQEVPGGRVRVVVVWMPVIRTDIAPPTTGVLSRVDHPGVEQLWDSDRLTSAEILRSAKSAPADYPPCRRASEDPVWDYVAVFPPGARWGDRYPPPAWHDGPLVAVEDGAKEALRRALGSADRAP